jgi:hypothetical protein
VQPEHFRFGGGAAETLMHPIVIVALILAMLLVFLLQRKYAVVPFLTFLFLTPVGQVFVVGGVHVFAYRILIFCGLARIVWKKLSSRVEIFSGGVNSLDKCFMLWAITKAVAPVILFKDSGAVINSFGFLLDALGAYLLLRFLIQDREDIFRVVKTLAILLAILTVSVLNEKFRYENIFGYLGTVSIIPEYRDGAVRPNGPFSHPLTIGTFAATLLGLFFMLWKTGKSKALGILGMTCSTVITLASSSSTPLMGYAAFILALGFWPLRKQMRVIRWGIVIGLITLHIIMKAPVWFIITHIDIIGSSSGYHRAELIDQLIRHFSDWWLVGTNDNTTWGWDMYDLANQFVAEGITGGLLALISFIAMISICFGWIGKARKLVEDNLDEQWFLWCLGGALFANVVAFFGISYFDQTRFTWFALLISISVATAAVWAVKAVPEHEAELVSDPRRFYPPSAVLRPTQRVSSKKVLS